MLLYSLHTIKQFAQSLCLCKNMIAHSRSNILCEPQLIFISPVDKMSDSEVACAAIIITRLTKEKIEKESREDGWRIMVKEEVRI